MNAITTIQAGKLPTEQDTVPTLTSRALHSRLLEGPAHELVRHGRLTEADLPALRDFHAECRRLLVGSSAEVVTMQVGKLSLHYPQPSMDENANATRWEDWFDDFGDIPADILESACRAWRRSDNRFAPSPGQLLAKCVEVKTRQYLEQRSAKAIELLEQAERQ
jgi:hypothetical protein